MSETKQQQQDQEPTKPSAAKKTAKKTGGRKSFGALVKEYPELQEILDVQAKQSKSISDLQARVGAMEVVAPASMRAMSFEEIKAKASQDPNFEFEVLEDWSFLGEKFHPGRRLCAAHYQHLMAYVKDGLRLGKPVVDSGEIFENASAARIRENARTYNQGS